MLVHGENTQPTLFIDPQDPLRKMLLTAHGPVEVSDLRFVSPAVEDLQKEKIILTIPLISQGGLIRRAEPGEASQRAAIHQ